MKETDNSNNNNNIMLKRSMTTALKTCYMPNTEHSYLIGFFFFYSPQNYVHFTDKEIRDFRS